MPVVPASQLQDFVKNTLLSVRNGIQAAIDDGFVCLVPKSVDFNVTVVADGELMVAVSKGLNAPNAEAITTTTTEAETEIATTKKVAARTSTTKGTETSVGNDVSTEKADSTDATDQSGVDEDATTRNTTQNESGTEGASSIDKDTVRQEQQFGRRSVTDVFYSRTD